MDELTSNSTVTLSKPRLSIWQRLKTPKVRWLILLAVALITLLVATGVTYARYARDRQPDGNQGSSFAINFGSRKPENDQLKLVTANLDGTLVAPDHAKRRPLAVMVENHPDARPQSGLNHASVIVEAITEGGITRFMVIFGSRDADKIGPIRSARPYFVQYASGWKALYAHAGGSEGGLAAIPAAPIVNLDDTVGYFHREPRAGIASEHTLFSSTGDLYRLATDRKSSLDVDFTPWKFEDDPSTSDRPSSQTASIDFSTSDYKVGWSYDSAADTYQRSQAGAPHKDAVSGDQLTAKNVAILSVTRQLNAAANRGKGEWTMNTIGSGTLKLLKHGRLVEGTWKKESLGAMVRFYDGSGSELNMGRGRTWLEITPIDVTVTIQ